MFIEKEEKKEEIRFTSLLVCFWCQYNTKKDAKLDANPTLPLRWCNEVGQFKAFNHVFGGVAALSRNAQNCSTSLTKLA